MAFKKFILEEGLEVTIYKRRRSRSLRLSINAENQVRVSIPLWAPYNAGVTFARSRAAWILEQRQPIDTLTQGQAVGKAHRLKFEARAGLSKPRSRIRGQEIVVSHPLNIAPVSAAVQDVADAAARRALRAQAASLLPQRLQQVAAAHGFQYKGPLIKQLKSRWGSCDHTRTITLNFFLLQLSWELIDYVLLHELVHTEHLNHSPAFWKRLAEVCPPYQNYRRELRKHKPVVKRLSTL